MNLKEVTLEELELPLSILKEGISAILHTLLFLRAPNQIKACDSFVPGLGLSYLKCGNGLQGLITSSQQDFIPVVASEEVDESVILALKCMTNCLTPVGPNLYRSVLILSFYESRNTKAFFGFMNNNEKVVFERWRIPILVNENTSVPNNTITNPNLLITPSQEILLAREQIQLRILYIIEIASYVDHVPPSLYEYEIEAGIAGEKKEQSIVTRLINSPSLLSNLT